MKQRKLKLDELVALMRHANTDWDQHMRAAWNAELCAKCGRPMAADDPVWIDTYPGYLRAATCRECVSWLIDEPEMFGPCNGGCGREVHVRERLDRFHLFCSRRCEIRFYGPRRKQERARQRRRRCTVCGDVFEPKRADAHTCGSACRQKAYRARKDGRQPSGPRSPAVVKCPQPLTVTPSSRPSDTASRELRFSAVDTRPEAVEPPAGTTAAALIKGQRTRDLQAAYVSAYTGQRLSGRTYEKGKAVIAAAKAYPEMFTGVVEEMDRTGNVNAAWHRLQRVIVKAAIEACGLNTTAPTETEPSG